MSDALSRRHFLKLSTALVAGGAAIACPDKSRAIGYTQPRDGQILETKGYCPFCQVRCTYRARVQGGKILSLTGDPNNHWTGGAMCPKGMSMVELVNSPYRITEPMFHEADGSWRRISYREAVDMVATRMKAVLQKYGDKAGNRALP